MKIKEDTKDLIFLCISVALVAVMLLVQLLSDRETQENVAIHIKGEVKNPGYYELGKDERVFHAIRKAGGITENAALSEINLAQKLCDGEEIIIPTTGEQFDYQHTKPEKSDKESNINDEKININTADMYLLCRIEGIGETTAQLIMDYRKENGPFNSIEEIMNIKGIGNAKFNKMKDRITVK